MTVKKTYLTDYQRQDSSQLHYGRAQYTINKETTNQSNQQKENDPQKTERDLKSNKN